MAVNWDLRPLAILESTVVTPRDTRVAAVTVRVVDPDTPPRVAETTAEPRLAAVVNPYDPEILLTEATAGSEELHVTELVRSCVELSV
jgi:hypothetical protein